MSAPTADLAAGAGPEAFKFFYATPLAKPKAV